MKQAKAQYLVVDSGAFIKNAPIQEYGENIFTIRSVVKEIKDKATIQRLQFLPYELKFQEPTPENIKYVTEFSKKTGDYPSLSAVDIQIIALTYQLEKEHVGTDHLNKEPVRGKVTPQPAEISKDFAGFYYPDKVEGEESRDSEGELNNKESDCCDRSSESEEDKSSEVEADSDLGDCNQVDDDDHWITPFNINAVKKKMGVMSITDDNKSVTVACVTTDFAVQNVLLQMGLHVSSVDGMLIKHTKVFVLRCYACYRTTSNMTKKFCMGCGNQTLKRVAMSINEDGSKKIHINFSKPINIRGTKYSLPTPRGGKHSENPILCEDQPIPQNKPPKSALSKVDIFSPDYEARSSPFAMNDVYSRAAQLGIRKANITVTKRNPNEPVRRIGKKKRNKKT